MENVQIAKTILDQLGGNRFMVMTGAKNLVAIDAGVRFRVGQNAKGINMVEVRLNGRDLYDMRFGRVVAGAFKEKAKVDDVWCDMLQEIFTAETGLYTKL